MKKLILFFVALSLLSQAYATEELQNVGIAKYAVIETTSDNVPIRKEADENAYRITHLFKNAVLFADKQNEDYYRVELNNNNFGYVNKKFVEVQAIIPEKRFDNINKIIFKNEKKHYIAQIETNSQSAFVVDELKTGLNFTLFDNRFDPTNAVVINKNNKFSFPDKIVNELNLTFNNYTPLFGYDVEKYDKGYIFKIKKTPKISYKKPLKNITVVIDPGHGGVETGVSAFSVDEKVINLEISKKLKRELQRRGAKVYLTRKKDKTVPLYDRPLFAKEKNADILLSIHQNSLPDPSKVDEKHGVGVYYYHNQSKPLAQKIQENLLVATDFQDDKVNYASFVLTRPTSQLSVLIECGYLIYEQEAEKLKDKKFQKIIAKAITKGCEDYLKETYAAL